MGFPPVGMMYPMPNPSGSTHGPAMGNQWATRVLSPPTRGLQPPPTENRWATHDERMGNLWETCRQPMLYQYQPVGVPWSPYEHPMNISWATRRLSWASHGQPWNPRGSHGQRMMNPVGSPLAITTNPWAVPPSHEPLMGNPSAH